MKKVLIIILLIPLFSKAQVISFKKVYSTFPDTITTNKSFDEVWQILTQAKLFPVQMEDKNNGLILTDETRLKWTYETNKGKLKADTAFVVVHREYHFSNNQITPEVGFNGYITGEVSLKIIPQATGTNIIINLVNVHKAYYSLKSGVTKYETFTNYGSTGNLEKLIKDIIE